MSDNNNVKSIRDHLLHKLTPEQQRKRQEGIDEVGIDLYDGDFYTYKDYGNMYNEMGEYVLQNDSNLNHLSFYRSSLVSYEVEENEMVLKFVDDNDNKSELTININELGKLQSRLKEFK